MSYFFKYTLVSLVLFLLGLTGIINPIRDLFQKVLNPISFGLYKVSLELQGEITFFANIRGIKNENLLLAEKNLKLLEELSGYKKYKKENEDLKLLLDLNRQRQKKFIVAKVLSAPSSSSEIYIDKGSADGIAHDFYAVYNGFVVGAVSEVGEFKSKIILINSPKLSVAGVDEDSSTRTIGLVTGDFGTFLTMDRILPEEVISVGDVVVTSGQDGVFGDGFILGEVVSVTDAKSSEPLRKAKLKTLIDFSKLETVFVGR